MVFSLPDAQQHFARTIAQGPAACPPELFAGSRERVLRGLKVHANTISHARLVALEDGFPQTRAFIGEDEFHALSQAYLDAGHGRTQSLDTLGEDFPCWLGTRRAQPAAIALAHFESCWLLSYRARDAQPLKMDEFAGLDPEGVLGLRLGVHPAAQVLRAAAGLTAALAIEGPADWLLITRPDAQVLVAGVDDSVAVLLQAFEPDADLASSFETFLAAWPNSDGLAAFHQLVAAGALLKVEPPCLP